MTVECPYCEKPLSDEQAACCGEVGHGVVRDASPSTEAQSLLPCPFCGAGETLSEPDSKVWAGMEWRILSWRVRHWCSDKTHGSMLQVRGKTQQEAEERWNRRSAPGARVEPVLYDKSRPQCACCGSTDPEHVKRICDANLPGEPVAKPNPCRNECSLISLDDDHWKCNHCDAVFAYTGAQKPVEKPRCWWPLCKETAGDALCDAVQSALTKGEKP